MLADAHFREVFKYFWNDFRTIKSYFISGKQWWDCAKVQIKQLCQEYTVNITTDIIHSMKKLQEEINELQNLAEQTGTYTEHLKTKKK